MKQEYLDLLNKSCNRISYCRKEINKLASAFLNSGNDFAANNLYRISADLRLEEERIHDVQGHLVSDYVKSVCQSEKNMFDALFAGITIGSSDTDQNSLEQNNNG